MKTRSVDLHVAGVTLRVKTDAGQDQLERLGAMVEERVHAIQRSKPAAPAQQVYLLAALTFAEEMLALSESQGARADKLRSLLELVREARDAAQPDVTAEAGHEEPGSP